MRVSSGPCERNRNGSVMRWCSPRLAMASSATAQQLKLNGAIPDSGLQTANSHHKSARQTTTGLVPILTTQTKGCRRPRRLNGFTRLIRQGKYNPTHVFGNSCANWIVRITRLTRAYLRIAQPSSASICYFCQLHNASSNAIGDIPNCSARSAAK